MISHGHVLARLTGSHWRTLEVVTRSPGGIAAAAEVRLQGGGTGRTKIHAADFWRCTALCGLFKEPLLPTFRMWPAPAPGWSERCSDCLLLVSADVNGDEQTSPRMAPGHIWTWTGSVAERMTVAADGVSFVAAPVPETQVPAVGGSRSVRASAHGQCTRRRSHLVSGACPEGWPISATKEGPQRTLRLRRRG